MVAAALGQGGNYMKERPGHNSVLGMGGGTMPGAMIDMLIPTLSSDTSTAPWEDLLPASRESLLQDLSRQFRQPLGAVGGNLGHLEEQLLRGSQ